MKKILFILFIQSRKKGIPILLNYFAKAIYSLSRQSLSHSGHAVFISVEYFNMHSWHSISTFGTSPNLSRISSPERCDTELHPHWGHAACTVYLFFVIEVSSLYNSTLSLYLIRSGDSWIFWILCRFLCVFGVESSPAASPPQAGVSVQVSVRRFFLSETWSAFGGKPHLLSNVT